MDAIEERVIVVRATYHTNAAYGEHAGTLVLVSRRGSVVSHLTTEQLWEIVGATGASHPDELRGKNLTATFQGAHLTGLST